MKKNKLIYGLVTFSALSSLALAGCSDTKETVKDEVENIKANVEDVKEIVEKETGQGKSKYEEEPTIQDEINTDSRVSSEVKDFKGHLIHENYDDVEKFEEFFELFSKNITFYNNAASSYSSKISELNEDDKDLGSVEVSYDNDSYDKETKKADKAAYEEVTKDLVNNLTKFYENNQFLFDSYQTYFTPFLIANFEGLEESELTTMYQGMIDANSGFEANIKSLEGLFKKGTEIHFDKFDKTSEDEREKLNEELSKVFEDLFHDYQSLLYYEELLDDYYMNL